MRCSALRLITAGTILLLSIASITPFDTLAQSKSSGASKSSQDASGAKSSGNSDSSGSSGQQNGGAAATRVEAAMTAYQAADTIATRISSRVSGRRIVVYDSQAFGAIQTYESYAAALKIFEASFRQGPPVAFDGGAAAQAVVSTLTAVKSSTDFAPQPLDSNQDALVAQIVHKLEGSSTVLVPKIILLKDNDLNLPADLNDVGDTDCSNINKTVPVQLSCIIATRNEGNNSDYIDKLFQLFIGNILGVSVTSADKKTPAPPPDPAPAAPPSPDPAAPAPQSSDRTNSASLLASIIQGHRLLSNLNLELNPNTRILVLEGVSIGGSYRIRHNFWREVFWTTPDPAFNGGAIITYLLINPSTSVVEQSETLRYLYKFGNFKNMNSVDAPANF
jgi:hypothetical protein